MPARPGVTGRAAGQHHLGRRAWRDGNVKAQQAAVHRPGGLDAAVRRLVRRRGGSQPAAGHRLDTERAVGGLVADPDSGGVPVQEADDRSLGVVVQRLVRHAVVVDSLPPFPDGRRALGDHAEPRRRGVLEQQLIRDVGLAGVGQRGQQVRGGKETSAQVRPGVADQLDKPRRRPLTEVLGQ